MCCKGPVGRNAIGSRWDCVWQPRAWRRVVVVRCERLKLGPHCTHRRRPNPTERGWRYCLACVSAPTRESLAERGDVASLRAGIDAARAMLPAVSCASLRNCRFSRGDALPPVSPRASLDRTSETKSRHHPNSATMFLKYSK